MIRYFTPQNLIFCFFLLFFVLIDYRGYKEIKDTKIIIFDKELSFPFHINNSKINISSEKKFTKIAIIFGGYSDFSGHDNRKYLIPSTVKIDNKNFSFNKKNFLNKSFNYDLNNPNDKLQIEISSEAVIKKIIVYEKSNNLLDFIQFNYEKLFINGLSFFFIPIFLFIFLISLDYLVFKILYKKSLYFQTIDQLPIRLILFFVLYFVLLIFFNNNFFFKLIFFLFVFIGFIHCLKNNVFNKMFEDTSSKIFFLGFIFFIIFLYSKYLNLNLYIEYASQFPNNKYKGNFLNFFVDSFYNFGHANFINDYFFLGANFKDYESYLLDAKIDWGFRIPNLFSYSLVGLLNFFQFKFLIYHIITFFIYFLMFFNLFKFIKLRSKNITIIIYLIIFYVGGITNNLIFENIQYFFAIMLTLILINNLNNKPISLCTIFIGVLTHPIFLVFFLILVLFLIGKDFFLKKNKKKKISIFFLNLFVISFIFYYLFFTTIKIYFGFHPYLNRFEILNLHTYTFIFSILFNKVLFYGNAFSNNFDFFSHTIILNVFLFFFIVGKNLKMFINFLFFIMVVLLLVFVERNNALYTSTSYNNLVFSTLSLLLLISSSQFIVLKKSNYFIFLFYVIFNFFYNFISPANLKYLIIFNNYFEYLNIVSIILIFIFFGFFLVKCLRNLKNL